MSALREIARRRLAGFRVTANQNLIVSPVRRSDVATVEQVLADHGVGGRQQDVSTLRSQALACVALPTCGLAMAEAERYLPELVGNVEALLAKHGIADEPLSLRMTGCPNGCARPYVAEIGLVGRAPGYYSLFLGGSANGTRLNRLALENGSQHVILDVLDGWIGRFAAERWKGESFGDFVARELPVAGERGG